MKTIAVILMTLSLVSFKQADNSTFSTATSNVAKLVVKFHGSEYTNLRVYQSSFYGQCLTAEVSNPSSEEATFSIDAGTLLTPDDPNLQRLIITENERMNIGPHSEKRILLYAMCTEADKGGAVPKTQFVISGNAPDSWTRLAELIGEHNFQNMAGQSAMWALTDNHPESEITDADANTTYILRNYVAQVKREPSPPAGSSQSCETPQIAYTR